MARCPYILAEAPVLVVGVLLASALLLDGLQAVVCPILHLLHSAALILHDKAEHLNLKSHRFELSACKILRLPLAISKSRKSLKGLVCRDAQDAFLEQAISSVALYGGCTARSAFTPAGV